MTKQNVFTRFLQEEAGATAIEYGLIAALIAIGIVVGATAFSTSINGLFGDVDGEISQAFDSSTTP